MRQLRQVSARMCVSVRTQAQRLATQWSHQHEPLQQGQQRRCLLRYAYARAVMGQRVSWSLESSRLHPSETVLPPG